MPTVKKKKSTKTAKRATTARTHKKAASRTCCKKCKTISNSERMHIYVVTALSIIAGILLCADIAMVIA